MSPYQSVEVRTVDGKYEGEVHILLSSSGKYFSESYFKSKADVSQFKLKHPNPPSSASEAFKDGLSLINDELVKNGDAIGAINNPCNTEFLSVEEQMKVKTSVVA